MPETHEVLLTVPALPEFLRVVRVTASGLSSRLGFSIDDVDDLRLALDELCFTLIGKGTEDAKLRLRYEVSDELLTILGTTPAPEGGNEEARLADFSRQILTALVDEHRVWFDEDGKHFSLTKQRAVPKS